MLTYFWATAVRILKQNIEVLSDFIKYHYNTKSRTKLFLFQWRTIKNKCVCIVNETCV